MAMLSNSAEVPEQMTSEKILASPIFLPGPPGVPGPPGKTFKIIKPVHVCMRTLVWLVCVYSSVVLNKITGLDEKL